jgi:hypothetical protein
MIRTLALALLLPTASVAADPPNPVAVEYYYRIKWGSAEEFGRLYRKNHLPILKEMQKAGFVRSMRTEYPFTHMAGGQRWDLRVTIVFRDASSAIEVGGPFDVAFEAAKKRLYPDATKLAAEEQARFALLEEHWDVVVVPGED